MARRVAEPEICLAQSGVMTYIKIGSAVIAGLMAIFSAVLGIMWNEQRTTSKEILDKIGYVASAADFEAVKTKVELIYSEQQRIKWAMEEREKDREKRKSTP